MRNKFWLLSCAIVFSLFSGCLNYIQDVQIYPDGSGKMTIHYWMNAPDEENFQILDRVGIFNMDSMRNQFSSEFSTIENVEVYTDTTDSTVHGIVKFSFIHIDSLNQTKAFSDANFEFRDGAAGQKIFSQFIPPIATGFGIDGSEFTVTYKYTFSGEIITHNALSEEGRTLVWNYSLPEIGRGKTISVTFRPYKLKETPYWIYIISGVVLLIVIVFLFRKKKD
ncbi:MAG: hypothetical protein IPM56_01945 [Ignavibacteriales bacterium]|nr:MAG: hypothetical protein IPM56_01945 [Ignavibacteriales bacterium]